MTLNKNTKEDIKKVLIIAYDISPDYYNKKIKLAWELRNILFDLTNGDYKKIDNEITEIIKEANQKILANQEQKTA